LVLLVDKTGFIAMGKAEGGLAVFSQSLEHTTPFELEEISKISELEERFVKFLKHIEILSPTDPSKVEGQKLINLIFSIEKYKAYQNMSLQLFDQEQSLVYEEELPVDHHEGGRHSVHMTPHRSLEAKSVGAIRGGTMVSHQKKVGFSRASVAETPDSRDILDSILINKDEDRTIELIKAFRSSDTLFYRAFTSGGFVTLWARHEGSYFEHEVPLSALNLL
jgi:hypothetical protein